MAECRCRQAKPNMVMFLVVKHVTYRSADNGGGREAGGSFVIFNAVCCNINSYHLRC